MSSTKVDIKESQIAEITVTTVTVEDSVILNLTDGVIEQFFTDQTEKKLGIDMTKDIIERHMNFLKSLNDPDINEIINEFKNN